jgi:aryl-alcohol dehydrogenase-like predicted oxidoreductase
MEVVNSDVNIFLALELTISCIINKYKEENQMKRTLGRSNITVSALGMGCWAIGGPWTLMGSQAGWGTVDDAESIKAIHKALALGVNFFDTAANYGCGHSERILGQALKGKRDKVIIVSKFGYKVDEESKEVTVYGQSEEQSDAASHVRADLEKSLARLGTDYLDVYLLHLWGLVIERALEVCRVLEDLVKEGKIRTYGWSTDRTDAIKSFSTASNCSVVEQQLNVLDGNMELLALCEERNLASINRGPLGMGMLTGKYTPSASFDDKDVRKYATWFPGIKNGRPSKKWLNALEAIKEVLTSKGRTLAQGALAWIWGRSPNTLPIPGFRTVRQVQENCGAMEFGPLTKDQMAEIDAILGQKI